jgi:hypothetical protein
MIVFWAGGGGSGTRTCSAAAGAGLLAALAEGGSGAPAGGLFPGPQWKMRVDIARAPCSPAPPGPDPTIVINSPVSTAWTWKAGAPFGSRHVFNSLQR